ncbi:MAG TPA: Holliday junction branch migration protein RuvA [Vicinamibacterales bacterium]|nr:Holliday junction branch migration protein RuvA [Acidobacteriota bacterium]HQZ40258.1 Holliday junction branch migration protein RuvA [Vicinamibacterales bacterium]
MIAFLRGRVLDKHPNRLVVDVGGVGYDVAIPLSTYYTIGDEGAEVTVRVHTHVREDQIALYGFASALELSVFERLIGVSGIGPRLALAVLSGIEARELTVAIQRADVARLTRIPGVGKKTAERMVVDLRDRLPKALESVDGEPPPADARRDDLASALANLGYDRRAIDTALDAALKDDAEASFEQHLRAALKAASRA